MKNAIAAKTSINPTTKLYVFLSIINLYCKTFINLTKIFMEKKK